MTSPLDNRIRHIAREEAAGVLNAAPAAVLESSGPDRLAELEQEVADLRARLEKLENTAPATATKRTPRKTVETSE